MGTTVGRIVHQDLQSEDENTKTELSDLVSQLNSLPLAVAYQLVHLILTVYKPGENVLVECYERFQTPLQALESPQGSASLSRRYLRRYDDKCTPRCMRTILDRLLDVQDYQRMTAACAKN